MSATAFSPTKIMALQEARRELRRLRFFHATGLLAFSVLEGIDNENEVQASRMHLGRWGYNENREIIVAILENGELWLAAKALDHETKAALRRICPKGSGAPVPCCNNESLSWESVARRYTNWQSYCNGFADPIPRPQ